MSEQWAFCERCHRWFYADRSAEAITDMHCPVCDASPTMVRDRPSADPAVRAS